MPLNFLPSSGEYNFLELVFDGIRERGKWKQEK